MPVLYRKHLRKRLVSQLDTFVFSVPRTSMYKAYFDDLYSDYGLLLCQADGRPIDQKALGKAFKELQRSLRIPKEEQIEFQGLRKSGQMKKTPFD